MGEYTDNANLKKRLGIFSFYLFVDLETTEELIVFSLCVFSLRVSLGRKLKQCYSRSLKRDGDTFVSEWITIQLKGPFFHDH